MSKMTISQNESERAALEVAGLKNLIALYHKRIGIIENIIAKGGDGDESPVYANMELKDMEARLADMKQRLAQDEARLASKA